MVFIVNFFDDRFRMQVNFAFVNKEEDVKAPSKSTKIEEVISPYDTIHQLKKKICIFALNTHGYTTSHIEDLFIWRNDDECPFLQESNDPGFEDARLLSHYNIDNQINCTTREKLLSYIGRGAGIVAKWLDMDSNRSSRIEESQKTAIENHSGVVTEVEENREKYRSKLLGRTLKITVQGHTSISAEIGNIEVDSKIRNIDLDRIYRRFKLSVDVPTVQIKSGKRKGETRVYLPAIESDEIDGEFWRKWKEAEDQRTLSIQFKNMHEGATVITEITELGKIKMRVTAQANAFFNEDKWKIVVKNTNRLIIDKIAEIVSPRKMNKFSYDDIVYYNITTNTNIGTHNIFMYPETKLIEKLVEYIPYFGLVESGITNEKGEINQLAFTKINDYQNRKNWGIITEEALGRYKENKSQVAQHLSFLFMMSLPDAQAQINLIGLQKQQVKPGGKGSKVEDRKKLANKIFFSFKDGKEFFTLQHYGKSFQEMRFAVETVRTLIYDFHLEKANEEGQIEEDENEEDEEDENEEDGEAFNFDNSLQDLANVDDIEVDDPDEVNNGNGDGEPVVEPEEVDPGPVLDGKKRHYKMENFRLPPAPPPSFEPSPWPPNCWDLEKTYLKNESTFRSSRLIFYDSGLYNAVFTPDGREPKKDVQRSKAKIDSSTSCQKQIQPLVFSQGERRDVLRNVEAWGQLHPEKEESRIRATMDYRNNWYLACEAFCFKCMLPLRFDELPGPKFNIKVINPILPKCPKCNNKDGCLVITNDQPGKIIVLHPRGPKQKLEVKDGSGNVIQVGIWPCKRSPQEKKKGEIPDPENKPDPNKTGNEANVSDHVMQVKDYPLGKGRYGHIPEVMHRMFASDDDIITNEKFPKRKLKVMTRFGLVDDNGLSGNCFLKLITYLYNQTPTGRNGRKESKEYSYRDIIDLVLQKLHDARKFQRTCGGSLIKTFSVPREDNDSYNDWIESQDAIIKTKTYASDIHTAYMNFSDFLNDDTIEKDHNLLWSVLCFPGVLWEKGLNLYLIRIGEDKAEAICPLNGSDYFYHYRESNLPNYTAFASFVELRETSHVYEPLVEYSQSASGTQLKGDSKVLFNSMECFATVAGFKQNCGVTHQSDYVNYLRENNFTMNPLPYDTDSPGSLSSKSIIQRRKDIEVIGQYVKEHAKMGIIIKYKSKQFYLPVKKTYIDGKLDVFDNLPCDSLGNYDEALKLYSSLKKGNIRCQPRYYTTELNSGKVNGFILETDHFVPIELSDLPTTTKLIKSERSYYDCNNETVEEDQREKYIREFQGFWSGYDKFCMEVAKSIRDSNSILTEDNWRSTITKNTKSVNSAHKDEYLEALLNEYDYNYLRRNDIVTGVMPVFLDNLEDRKVQKDVAVFKNTNEKIKYIENRIKKAKYEKFMKYTLDNSSMLDDKSKYLESSSGIKLPKTWQMRLHRNFRYNLEKYDWMRESQRENDHVQLKELQSRFAWKELSMVEQINACIVILKANGATEQYFNPNSNPEFYLLFYKMSTKEEYYPVFLPKSPTIMQYKFKTGDLTTEFFDSIQHKCVTDSSGNIDNEEDGEDIEDSEHEDSEPEDSELEEYDDGEDSAGEEEKDDGDGDKGIYCKMNKNNGKRSCNVSLKKDENSSDCIYDKMKEKCKIKPRFRKREQKRQDPDGVDDEVYCKLNPNNAVNRSCVMTNNKDEASSDCIYDKLKEKCKIAPKETKKKLSKMDNALIEISKPGIYCKLNSNSTKRSCSKTTKRDEASSECTYDEQKDKCKVTSKQDKAKLAKHDNALIRVAKRQLQKPKSKTVLN